MSYHTFSVKLRNLLTVLSDKGIILVFFIVGFLLFGNSLFNGFTGDDIAQIINNPQVKDISNIPRFFEQSTFYNGQANSLSGIYYKPLIMTYYTIVYSIFGQHATVFHLIQIVGHIANSILLYILFKHFFEKHVAIILAIVFLIHPINSEAVLYISDMQDISYFFFGIIGLLSVVKYTSRIKWLFLSSCLFLLSLFSKETGILFILLAILYVVIYKVRNIFKFISVLCIPLVIYLNLKIHAVGFIANPSNNPIANLSLGERLLNIPAIIFYYLSNFLFPLNITSGQRWAYTDISIDNFFYPLIFDLVIFALVLFTGIRLLKNKSLREFKIYIYFTLWFITGLLLHIQIIPLDLTVADRWFYFPGVGLIVILYLLIKGRINVFGSKLLFTCFIIVIIALSARTFIRTFDWRDQITLKRNDINISGEKDYIAYNTIAADLIVKKDYSNAEKYIMQSIAIFPNETNYNLLGIIYVKQKKYADAKKIFLKGLTYGDSYFLYEALGQVGVAHGNPEENIKFLKNALLKFPSNSNLWLYLSILEYNNKNIVEAKYAINQAYRYNQNTIIGFVKSKISNNEELKINLD